MLSSSLSSAQRRLVRLMQELNFGRIENLVIRRGEPVWESPPRLVREIKFGAENGPRAEADKTAFVLKTPVRELLGCLEALGEGQVAVVEIKHGLPFRMVVEEVLA